MNTVVSGNVTNVLFFLPSQKWGWKERFVIKAMKVLERTGINCFLVCKKGTRISENAAICNIRCIHMIAASSATFLPGQLYRFYKKIIKEYEIDAIHFFSLFHFFTFNWVLQSFPKIPIFLDVLYLDQYKKWKRVKNFLLKRVDYVFIAREIDSKVVSDFFNFPSRKIITHHLCIGVENKVRFIKNESNQKMISVYLDYAHSVDLFEVFFKGITLFANKFRESVLLKIVFDKINYDRTKLALINSLLENYPSIKFEFLDITDDLASDCHVVLFKNILDEYTLNLLGYQLPILIPRGALLYEQTLGIYDDNFYQEGDLRELTNLLAAKLLAHPSTEKSERHNDSFVKKNSDYVFQRIIVDYYRLSRERRLRRYASLT